MESLAARRRVGFGIALVLLALVCVAIARLPDPFVTQIENQRPFSSAQAGWAYRLLAVAAIAQALYGGFVLLRPERIRRARTADPKMAAMTTERIVDVLARTATVMVILTIVYGSAAFAVTGERGGFWLFPIIALAQGFWYYREVGMLARWLAFQEEPETEPRGAWRREPADYSPPLARGLSDAFPRF